MVADLEEIAPWTQYRMFAKFIPDFRNRQRRNLQVHEFGDTPRAVAQFVVDRMINARSRREPRHNAENGQAAAQNKEIPGRKTEADGSFLQRLSSSRSAYPTPRMV